MAPPSRVPTNPWPARMSVTSPPTTHSTSRSDASQAVALPVNIRNWPFSLTQTMARETEGSSAV